MNQNGPRTMIPSKLQSGKKRLKQREKIKLSSHWAQVHNALERTQGLTTKHARRQQVPQTN